MHSTLHWLGRLDAAYDASTSSRRSQHTRHHRSEGRCGSQPVIVRCLTAHSLLVLVFCRCRDVSKHLNMFREKLTGGVHKHVPRIAYNVFKKNFVAPAVKEGFKEIRMIDFSPYFDDTPAGQKAKALFYQLS